MSIDFPRAWQIAEATPFDDHHPKCSFRTQRGGLLCDCDVVYKHPEYLKEDVFYSLDGTRIENKSK